MGISEEELQRLFQPSARFVCACVKDTGVGISEEELKRLFQPFSQVCVCASVQFFPFPLSLSLSFSANESLQAARVHGDNL